MMICKEGRVPLPHSTGRGSFDDDDDDDGALWKAYPGLHPLSLRPDEVDDAQGQGRHMQGSFENSCKREDYDPREDPEKVV